MTDPVTGQNVESLWRGSSYNFGPRLDGRQLLWWDGQYRSYSAQKIIKEICTVQAVKPM